MKEKKEKIMLIASYKREYSNAALNKILRLIQKMKPDKIVVIKVVEERPTKELVSATVGMEEKTSMQKSIRDEKKIRSDELASDLVKMIKQFDIPIEVYFRIGEQISQEIINEFKRQDANLLIIHDTKKGRLDKLFGSNTTEEIMGELDEERVIRL